MSDVGIEMGAHGRRVHIKFSRPVEYVSLTPEEVQDVINALLENNARAIKQDPVEVIEAQKPDRSQPITGKCLNCGTPKRANEFHCPACGYPWKQ